MGFVWGVFIFAKVRFASFAVLGPFTNGPYEMAVCLCGMGCWLRESPSVPSLPLALTPGPSPAQRERGGL